jgi:hypothetical protein
MTHRRARCANYGQPPGSDASPSCPAVRDHGVCQCEQPSMPHFLPFFEPRPAEPYDAYYCGCGTAGWD